MRRSLWPAMAGSAWLPLVGLALCAAGLAQAQGLRPATGGLNATLPAASASAAPRAADHIVAIVNGEPVTASDVRLRLSRVEQQATEQGTTLPPRAALSAQVLERLIAERAQLQWAAERGLKVDDATLNEAERSVAQQNRMAVEALRRQLQAQGIDPARFREELGREILLQRVREREVDARVRVSERDIDDYLQNQRQAAADPSQWGLHLAQVLVQVPEGADAATLTRLQARAQDVAQKARSGADFAQLAREFSDAPERQNGGSLGLRPANRYPDLFVQAVQALPAGQTVAGPLRSPAGFHILKLLDKQQAGLPPTAVPQTRARHILLRTGPTLSEAAAVERLAAVRQRIASGQANFEALARELSQDGSAPQGGDLGWANPGQFVPEFEQVMNSLAPQQVSAPVVSRFGVHLIRVDERRLQPLPERDQREWVRNRLREQQQDEAYANWARDLRARAFVEFREPPQ